MLFAIRLTNEFIDSAILKSMMAVAAIAWVDWRRAIAV